MGDWLGTGTIAPQKRNYRTFEEAKQYVRGLKLRKLLEWVKYCRSGEKPLDIPAAPEHVYKKQWKGLGDWLGTRTVANFKKEFKSFKEARAFAHLLQFTSSRQWIIYCKSG
jgi:hypothetical protein